MSSADWATEPVALDADSARNTMCCAPPIGRIEHVRSVPIRDPRSAGDFDR